MKNTDKLAMLVYAFIVVVAVVLMIAASTSKYYTPEAWDAVMRAIP